MSKNPNSYIMLTLGAILILLGPMIIGEGSVVKDVTKGIVMGLGVVAAVVGLLKVRSKSK